MDAIQELADKCEEQAAEIERLKVLNGFPLMDSELQEQDETIAELRAQLAEAEKQRDQAVELLQSAEGVCCCTDTARAIRKFLDIIRGIGKPERGASSGEEPAARHTPKTHGPGDGDTTGLSAASATCEPMTGQQMYELWDSVRHGTNWGCRKPWDEIHPESVEAWNALAAHRWPNAQPQPDRRDQLRAQVKRTDHGDRIVILELSDRGVILQRTSAGWWWNCPSIKNDCREKPLDEAIAAATDWLIEQALKGEEE